MFKSGSNYDVDLRFLSKGPIAGSRGPMSEETRQKLRDANLGKKHTKEARKKMSKAHESRPPHSAETKNKISKSQIGFKKSAETKRKISESVKRKNLTDSSFVL